MANPLLEAMRSGRKAKSLYDEDSLYQDSEDGPGLLSRIGQGALSGVSAVGNFLDIPGSMTRDLLGGENPFDQLLSPFSDTNRLTGRDLLRKHGMVGSEDTYGNWWGGLGVELLTDPTTYLGIGALTKSGRAVKAAGLLGDAALDTANLSSRMTGSLAKVAKATSKLGVDEGADALKALGTAAKTHGVDLADEGALQSLLHVGIPFTDIGAHIGTGEFAQSIASRIDKLGTAAKGLAPTRALRMLFDPSVKGQFDRASQIVEEAKYAKADQALKVARLNQVEHLKDLGSLYQDSHDFFQDLTGMAPENDEIEKTTRSLFDRTVRMATELGHDPQEALRYLTDNGSASMPAAMRDQFTKLTTQAQRTRKKIADSVVAKGGKMRFLENIEPDLDLSTHHPRYADFANNPDKLKNLATKSGSMLGREDVGRYLPTEVWKDIAADPAARGDDAARYIADKWGQFLGKGEQYAGDVTKHAEDLGKWASEHAGSLPFSRESADDHFKYMLGMSTVDKNLDAMHNVVMQHAKDGAEYPLARVFKLAGLDVDKTLAHLSKLTGEGVDKLSAKGLDADMANAIIGSQKAVNNPIWAGKIAEAVDKFNSAFKQGVTLPFPSFWTRNFLGGQYTNLAASGEIQNLADLAAYGKHVYSMSKAARDGVDPKLMEELYIHNVFKPDQLAQDVAANLTEKPGAWGMPLSGPSNPFAVGQTWRQAGEPLKDSLMRGILGDKVIDKANSIPGVKQAGQAYQTVIGTGSKASQWVEWANRVPMYMYLTREKGWDAMAAAQKVAELQIDYSKLAPFEKDVMRRLVPFYSFQRKMAPVLFNTLLERPGGALAQTIRLENRAHGEDALTPEHVASTLAIPNPWKTPEEGQSYITGFGLPFEQTAQFFGNFPSLREGGREALSQTTPLIKAPLEWASGQSFFQSGSGGAGRSLEELDPTLSRTISNVTGAKLGTPDLLEFAVSNSPLSRIATTARTVTDTRKTAGEKALNLLTGVRVTDVSPAAEDAVLRDRAKEVMRDLGAKTFEKVYFSKEDLAQMDPKQRAEAEKFQALMALLATKAKERKKLTTKKAG